MTKHSYGLSWIDVLAGCVVASCLGAFVWLGFVESKQAGHRIDQLSSQLQAARRDTAALLAAREEQKQLLAARTAELAETGQLPAKASVEEYFESLSILTRKLHLSVLRHQPLAPRRYPGLLEQRYTYEVTGSTPDLVHFLQKIEGTSFWADVSFLKIETGKTKKPARDDPRIASLTISLFSALPVETNEKTTGT